MSRVSRFQSLPGRFIRLPPRQADGDWMRIWDKVPPSSLCRQHLLAQWRESLGLWNILIQGKKGYANHPETKRWRGFERALWCFMSKTRDAMIQRGWNPKPLPDYPLWVVQQKSAFTWDEESWPKPWDDQIAVLRAKKCECEVQEVHLYA